jgi:hypothetical protein
VRAGEAREEDEAGKEEEEDMSASSETGLVAEWLRATTSGMLRAVVEDEHSVWARRERDRYMDHGGGDIEHRIRAHYHRSPIDNRRN